MNAAPPRQAGMLARALRNLGLLLVGLGAGLVLVEAGFRVSGRVGRHGVQERGDRPEFYYHREGAKDLGDYPYSPKKPPGTFRVGVVGDSFTFGPYLQLDDTFPKRLERMLNLNIAQPRVEVISYGVPRYSTSHEIQTTAQALREGADLVILQVTLNDAEIKPYRPTGLIRGSVNRFGQVDLRHGIFRYWRSAAFFVSRIYNARSRQGYIDYHDKLFFREKTWNHFAGSARKIAERCRAAQVPLAAVVFPVFALPLDESYPFVPIHEKVGGFLRSLEIPVLDLLPAFRGIPVARLQMMPGKEFHPNEIANRVAAEAIYLWLERERLVPEESLIRTRYRERIGLHPEEEGPPE